MSKTCVIYHNCDLDGQMSAAIVKHWFMSDKSNFKIGERKEDGFLDVNSIEFIGYNYGQLIPDLSEYDKVIMCDISFPIEEMEELRQRLQDKFIWIDHHISAMKAVNERTNNYYDGLRDTKFAACELTWKYFFPNEIMPEIVKLFGLYDSFRHKNTSEELRVLEFQYGARAFINNYEDAYSMLREELTETASSIVNRLHLEGISIYNYLCAEAKQSYKNGFTVHFELNPCAVSNNVKKFICINKERFNPINFGIDYHKDGYDGAACFHVDTNGVFCFSLYNDNGEVDCSQIAKQYGGGGHFSASGFRCDSNTFLKIIKNG